MGFGPSLEPKISGHLQTGGMWYALRAQSECGLIDDIGRGFQASNTAYAAPVRSRHGLWK